MIESACDPLGPLVSFRQMTGRDQHDTRRDNVQYGYVILVQDTTTGEVGIIDPYIDTNPVKPPRPDRPATAVHIRIQDRPIRDRFGPFSQAISL